MEVLEDGYSAEADTQKYQASIEAIQKKLRFGEEPADLPRIDPIDADMPPTMEEAAEELMKKARKLCEPPVSPTQMDASQTKTDQFAEKQRLQVTEAHLTQQLPRRQQHMPQQPPNMADGDFVFNTQDMMEIADEMEKEERERQQQQQQQFSCNSSNKQQRRPLRR